MIKESKYILRRILIGVGIVLLLGFIRSNKAHALNTEVINYVDPILNKEVVMSVDIDTEPYYCYIINYLDNSTRFQFYLYSSSNKLKWNTHNNFWNRLEGSNVRYQWYNSWNNASGSLSNQNYNSSNPIYFAKFSLDYAIQNNQTNNSILLYCNYTPVNNSNEPLNLQEFISGNGNQYSPPTSSIISLNPVKFNTASGVIFRYFFAPEFSNFNTDNYIYQYKFGNGSVWLNLSQNTQLLQVNNNGTIYVRVKDKNTNEVVDSQTYTITDIGTFATNQNYNIKFSGEYRTENYLNNNVSKLQSVIREYQIYIDYLPKVSILKYQYQYITSGTCNDVQTWQQVSSADNGYITYVASQNGTLCARILDSSDTVQYEDSFEVSTIGDLAFDTGSNQVKGFFDKISSKINYGGPVGSLFRIPVETLNTLYSSMNNSNSCTPYSLPPILGTTMQFGCYNFKNIVGNSVYNIIDAIFTFILCIGLFKMALKLYHNLISMKDIS